MEICGSYRGKFGNNPIWHEQFGVIWLDTSSKKIITYDPVTNKETIYEALGKIKALVPKTDGQFIGVYSDGLYHLNFVLGMKKPFVKLDHLTNMYYLNNAKCSPTGEIWFGLTDRFFNKFKEIPQTAFTNYPFENVQLYSVNQAKNIQVKLDNIASSNGLEWDRQSNKFYHIDAPKNSISQYELLEDGQLHFEKIVYTFQIEDGLPGGLTIDTKGNLYVALFKSRIVAKKSQKPTRIVCINPHLGKIVQEFIIPISHVTSCVIGGSKMSTLFITTAYEPLHESLVKEEPFAGYLLKVELESEGVPVYSFDDHFKFQ